MDAMVKVSNTLRERPCGTGQISDMNLKVSLPQQHPPSTAVYIDDSIDSIDNSIYGITLLYDVTHNVTLTYDATLLCHASTSCYNVTPTYYFSIHRR